MNLRQKCKKYKQRAEMLGEMLCPTREIIVDRTNLKHFRTCYKCPSDAYFLWGLESIDRNRQEFEAKNHIWHELSKLVDDNIKYNEKENLYTLDVWV